MRLWREAKMQNYKLQITKFKLQTSTNQKNQRQNRDAFSALLHFLLLPFGPYLKFVICDLNISPSIHYPKLYCTLN